MIAYILYEGPNVYGVFLEISDVARAVSENQMVDWTVTPLTTMDSAAEEAADLLVKEYLEEWF